MERYKTAFLWTFPGTWLATPAQTTRATESLWWPRCHSYNGWMDEKSPSLREYWVLRYTGTLSRPRATPWSWEMGAFRHYIHHSFVQRYDELREKIIRQQQEYLTKRVGVQLALAVVWWSVRRSDGLSCSQEREKREHELKKARMAQQKKPGFDGRWYTDPNGHLSHEWVSSKDEWLGWGVSVTATNFHSSGTVLVPSPQLNRMARVHPVRKKMVRGRRGSGKNPWPTPPSLALRCTATWLRRWRRRTRSQGKRTVVHTLVCKVQWWFSPAPRVQILPRGWGDWRKTARCSTWMREGMQGIFDQDRGLLFVSLFIWQVRFSFARWWRQLPVLAWGGLPKVAKPPHNQSHKLNITVVPSQVHGHVSHWLWHAANVRPSDHEGQGKLTLPSLARV